MSIWNTIENGLDELGNDIGNAAVKVDTAIIGTAVKDAPVVEHTAGEVGTVIEHNPGVLDPIMAPLIPSIGEVQEPLPAVHPATPAPQPTPAAP